MNRLPPIAIGARRWRLAALAGNGLLQGACAAVASLALGRLAEGVGSAAPAGTAAPFAVAIAASLVLGGLRARELIDAERLGQHYVIDVRDALYRAAVQPSPQAPERRPEELLLRFVTDLNGLRQWVSRGLAALIGDGLFLIVLLVVIGSFAPLLAAVAGIGVLLLLALTRLLRDPLRTADEALRRSRGRLSRGIARQLSARHPARHLERDCNRLRERGEALAEAAAERARWQGMARASAVVVAPLTVAAMLLTARASGALDTGAIVTLITVAGLITTPLQRLVRAFELRQTWHVAHARALAVLGADALSTDPVEAGPGVVPDAAVSPSIRPATGG